MSHVFVSYSRKDEDFTRRLVRDLKNAGLDVWFDRESIQPGEQWDKEIEEGLRAAIAVIVVLSPDSMASDNVRNEINFARDNDQLILPVLFRPTQVILNLESIQWIDLSSVELYKANLITLVDRITKGTALMNNRFQTPDLDAGLFSGVSLEAARDRLTIANDSRQVSPAQLKRYLRILAVIASPFSRVGSSKAAYIDLSLSWRNLASAIAQHPLEGDSVPVALVRLAPSTAANLDQTLETGYQIVHLMAHSSSDMLYLETEHGLEDRLTASRLAAIFAGKEVDIVVSHQPLGLALTEALQAHVKAIVQPNTRPSEALIQLFDTRFYGRLSNGDDLNKAFEAAQLVLPSNSGIRYTLLGDATLERPENPAEKPLIDPSLPRLKNVPVNLGFIGRSLALREVSEVTHDGAVRQMAIYGLGGIGKSWLAAEFVARYGWRFPDGILWMRISEQTKSEDIIGQLLALLELPASTSPGNLRTLLRNRSVLVVLDQANEWLDRLEIGELADFVARLDPVSGTRFIVTAWSSVEPLTHTSGTRSFILTEMTEDDARHLVEYLIEAHDLEADFNAVPDAIDRLLAHTHQTPWLIREAIELIKLDGLESTLEDLQSYPENVVSHLMFYVGRQVERLEADSLLFLTRLQGIPDSFDRDLAQAISETDTRDILRNLLRRNLLRREGRLYNLPATVRSYLRRRHPLSDAVQDRIDESVIKHMLGVDDS